MKILHQCCSSLFLAIALFATSTHVAAATPEEFSEAEKRLFTDAHLKNIGSPMLIEYAFIKRGALEPAADDKVTLNVKSVSGAARAVAVQFLSGERALTLPDVDDAISNPVILHFLERDVREMNRLTKGSMAYYRKRIRIALAESARVRPANAVVDGKSVNATEVVIEPYKDDPARSRFEKYANKRYTFLLADSVPGSVVEIRSEMTERAANSATDTPPILVMESVTYRGRSK